MLPGLPALLVDREEAGDEWASDVAMEVARAERLRLAAATRLDLAERARAVGKADGVPVAAGRVVTEGGAPVACSRQGALANGEWGIGGLRPLAIGRWAFAIGRLGTPLVLVGGSRPASSLAQFTATGGTTATAAGTTCVAAPPCAVAGSGNRTLPAPPAGGASRARAGTGGAHEAHAWQAQ